MALGDAQDNLARDSNLEQLNIESISDTPAFQTPGVVERVPQQLILPGALVGRLQSPVQYFQIITSGVAVVPTGSSVINNTVTQNQGHNPMIQIVSRQVYVGGERMPEVTSSSSFPHYEWESLYDESGTETVFIGDMPWKTVHKIQVRNNSGSTQSVQIQLLIKYIANRSDGTSRP